MEASIAVTQNFVSTANLERALSFLEAQPQNVSGLPCGASPKEAYKVFLDALKESGDADITHIVDKHLQKPDKHPFTELSRESFSFGFL